MLNLELTGMDALESRFGALPAALLDNLFAKAAVLADTLRDKVKNDKLSGQALNAVSGALRDSIQSEATREGGAVSLSVGSVGDIKYAAIQEYGGKTAAHEILPSKANVLAFAMGGGALFAKRVAHPGSVIPERSYLRSSLEEMTADILAAFAASAGDAWGRL